jgi:hypothetical protein
MAFLISFAHSLRHVVTGLALGSALLATPALAALTQVSNRAALPAAGQQTVSWDVIGGDFADAGAAPTSGTVTVTGASAFTVLQQAPIGSWNGDFAAGESALVMLDVNSGNFTDGVFDITLGGAWAGFGVQVGSWFLGQAWEIDVLFYDAANVLLGSFDNLAGITTDAQDGSAYFLGAVSSNGDIARVVISGLGEGAAINQISLSPRAAAPLPAPATLLLAMAALGALAAVRRRA